MKQHATFDSMSIDYADDVDAIWRSWEPHLRSAQRLLTHSATVLADADDTTDRLRQIQYQAHTASEFAGGLQPPVVASEAHEYLLATLDACRDTLSVLAARADMGELDEQTAEIGLHAVTGTREAFQLARYSSMTAYAFDEEVEPMLDVAAFRRPNARSVRHHSRAITVTLWTLGVLCAVLLGVLLAELFLLPPA
jgi:hypothetical protein